MRSSLLALLLCLSFSVSRATDKVQLTAIPSWLYAIKPDINKKPVTKNISNGYYLELYDQQVNLLTNTRYIHGIRNIVNETGVQNASEVSISFAPQYQEIEFHTVSLIRNGKVVTRLTRNQIRVVDEESEASEHLYYGKKRAFVILKDVQKNDRIEYAYSIKGFNPVFKNKYSDKIYFTSSTAICNYFETIIAPETRGLHFKLFNGASGPVTESKQNALVYHWSNPATRTWESQVGVPSWFDDYPYVSITEYNNWQEVISWGNQLFNNYQHSLPEALQEKIANWRKISKGDREQFATLAIRYVQDQIRYLGMEMGENTHKPHAPAEVFQHSYGDCKDKSLLLAMILQQENIPAYVAMLNTSKKETIVEAAPSPDEFDHAIVAIKRSSGYIYVDPTITHQRGELINLFIPAYGYSLVIKDGESALQRVEPDAFNASHIEEKLRVSYLDTSTLEVTSVYKGGRADDTRSALSGFSTSELEDNYTQYYEKSFDGIVISNAIDVKDDSSKNEITVKESYKVPELWSLNAEGQESFEVFAKAIYDIIPSPSDIAKNAPMALSFPSTTYYTLSIVMPSDWTFPMDAVHIKNNSYQFDFTPQVVGKTITLKYVFKTFKDHIPADEVAKYKSEYKKMMKKTSFELYRNITTPSPTTNPFGGLNWPMVYFSFGVMAGISFLFRYLNNWKIRSIHIEERTGWPIGSWLVLLGISLVMTCIVELIEIFSGNFFDRTVWATLGEDGGKTLQSLAVAELAFGLIVVSGGAACFYWFIKRRDIFPKMFIGYVGSLLMGNIILLTLYSFIPYPTSYGDLAATSGTQLVKTVIYALIWVTYIIRSERARNTFVKTA